MTAAGPAGSCLLQSRLPAVAPMAETLPQAPFGPCRPERRLTELKLLSAAWSMRPWLAVAMALALRDSAAPGALDQPAARLGGPVACRVSAIQTIPSLAIFGVLDSTVPLVGGLGARPANRRPHPLCPAAWCGAVVTGLTLVPQVAEGGGDWP